MYLSKFYQIYTGKLCDQRKIWLNHCISETIAVQDTSQDLGLIEKAVLFLLASVIKRELEHS